MPKESRLIENIRILIGDGNDKAFAAALGVTPSAVSQWLNGKKKPGKDSLEKISKRYSITVEQLQYSDLSERQLVELPPSKRELAEMGKSLYPFVKSEEALKNPHFYCAYCAYKQLHEASSSNPVANDRLVDVMLEEYRLAISEDGCVEAACNLMTVILITTTAMVNQQLIRQLDRVPENSPHIRTIFKHVDLGDIPLRTEEDEQFLKFYIKEMDEEIRELLSLIRTSTLYHDYAEYFVALRYFLGAADNEYDLSTNRQIGSEMMKSFAEMGNELAIKFFQLFSVNNDIR